MASYDLRCTSCNTDFEVFVQGFLKDEDRRCPECGGTEVEQRFTGFMACTSSSSRGSASAPAPSCGSAGFG